MKRLFTELVIVLANIKDYLFYLFDKQDRVVHILNYDPAIAEKGKIWQDKISSILPGFEVTMVGSAALGLPGQKDLDYIIGYNPKTLEHNGVSLASSVNRLEDLLGKPHKTDTGFYEWSVDLGGMNIEVLLAQDNNRWYQRMVDATYFLKQDRNLLNEYKTLKLEMNGKRYKDYELRRQFLFNKIFYKYGRGLDFIS